MTIIPSGTGWPNPQRVETGGAGGITSITATDASVTVTNPTGPIVGLSANGGSQPFNGCRLAAGDRIYVSAADFDGSVPPKATAALEMEFVGSGTNPAL